MLCLTERSKTQRKVRYAVKNCVKFISFLLCAVMLFAFTSCDSTEPAENSNIYTIYSDMDFAPFEYYDEDAKEYVGIDMDLLAAIAEDQKFEYEIRNVDFNDAMDAVQDGSADGMIAGMTITEKRKATFDFSDGYFENGSVLVVAKDSGITTLEDLKDKIVAVKRGTTSATYVENIRDQYGFTVTYYSESSAMYGAVESGSTAACFEDNVAIGWAIRNDDLKLEIATEVLNPGYYAFAVKKGENAELIELFNNGLRNIKENGKYDEILANYGF